jgi:16S rRNA (guanine966-N2)-methyltransferase
VAEVLVQDATSYLKSCNTQFDIVFIDPPFKSGLVLPTLHALAKSNLAPGGMVYAEFSRGELVLPSDWQKLKSGMTKNVEFCLLVRR